MLWSRRSLSHIQSFSFLFSGSSRIESQWFQHSTLSTEHSKYCTRVSRVSVHLLVRVISLHDAISDFCLQPPVLYLRYVAFRCVHTLRAYSYVTLSIGRHRKLVTEVHSSCALNSSLKTISSISSPLYSSILFSSILVLRAQRSDLTTQYAILYNKTKKTIKNKTIENWHCNTCQ